MGARRSRTSKPGFVRIIGGEWRRRRIAIPVGLNIRPTPDRVRETLFNWLDPILPGSRCLDLYAGSGVLGLEALSRGAAGVVLVDRDAHAVAALEALRQELTARARIVHADAVDYLTREAPGPFDIVFVDPPYSMNVVPVLEAVLGVTSPGARVYLERERGDAWPGLRGLTWIRRAAAGAVDFGVAERVE